MVENRRKRRGKKPGPKPLPHDSKRKRITITLAPKYHKQVAAHKSPGMFVEHCVSLARCITGEQFLQLADLYLATGKTVDKLVHDAVKGYLDRFGTPPESAEYLVGPLLQATSKYWLFARAKVQKHC